MEDFVWLAPTLAQPANPQLSALLVQVGITSIITLAILVWVIVWAALVQIHALLAQLAITSMVIQCLFLGLQCTSCPSLCSTCSNNGICSKCSSGYYLDGNTCTACSSSICTCSALQSYWVVYSGQEWMGLVLGIMLLYLVFWVDYSYYRIIQFYCWRLKRGKMCICLYPCLSFRNVQRNYSPFVISLKTGTSSGLGSSLCYSVFSVWLDFRVR